MELLNSIGPDDYVNICYTSGTTADPKGIILSHRNYTANIEQTLTLMDVPEWWSTLLILPWDHAFAHTVGIYILMATGSSLAAVQSGKSYLDRLKNIPGNIREIKPVFMLSAPSLAKNLRKGIEKGIRDKGKTAEKLFNHTLKISYIYNGIGWDRGKGLRIFLKPLVMLYDAILFKKIRASFGGRLKFFFGGAALLDIELQRFFYAIGIPMLQGYGLSEAAPVISGNTELKHKLGSSGIIVKNLDLKRRSDFSERAFDRALELLDLSVADTKNRSRLRELLRVREALADHFVFDNLYQSSSESWQRYFRSFLNAVRGKH